MKKFTALFMTALMLLLLLPMGAAEAGEDYSWIKVKLSTNNATSIAIYASGTYFIKENGAEFTGGTITVRSNYDGTMTLSHSGLGDVYTGGSASIMRADIDRSAGYLKLGGYCYLGHFNLKCTSSGYIRVVNEVPLAHYLYGVVGYEMSNTFPVEALKAQSVAAKCYVLSRISLRGDYYIGDTSSEQVYRGYNASYTNVIEAVDSTIDRVLAVNGSMLCTYYAASNGGETLLPSQAWPSKSVSDRGYDIRLDPYDLGNAYSRMETIKMPIGMAGSITPGLMNMLLYKASYKLGCQVDQINSIYSVSFHDPRYSGTSRCMNSCTIELDVSRAGYSEVYQVELTFPTVEFESYGVVRDSTLRSFWGEMGDDGYYRIYHVRYGHGVGMSQRGAQEMAVQGKSYEEILEFYYPGASFARINVSAPKNPVNSGASAVPSGDGIPGVTTGSVRLRSGPGTNYSSLGTVPKGSDIVVYSRENGWAKASFGGSSGYVSEKYIDYPGGVPDEEEASEPTAAPQTGGPANVQAYGSVNGHGVNLRTGPGTSHSSIDKLDKGTKLYILRSTSGWYEVEDENGRRGFMISTYVSITGYPADNSDAEKEQEVDVPIAPPEPAEPSPGPSPDAQVTELTVKARGRVTSSGVNFRTGPATSYSSMRKLGENTALDIYGRTGDWYYGSAEGEIGYISSGYVEITHRAEGDAAPETENPKTEKPGDKGRVSTVKVGRITASGVNMRIGPDTSYTSLRKLKKDTGVVILGSRGSWFSVQTGGIKGYVHDSYVAVTGTETVDVDGNLSSGVNISGAIGKGVTTGRVRLRKGPGTETDIVTTLDRGDEITLFAMENGWYSAKLPDGRTGYVSSKYVKMTEAYAPDKETAGEGETEKPTGEGVTTANVNFRRGPATSDKKITTLPRGTEVKLYGSERGWYEAEYKGTRGYLYAKYVAAKGGEKEESPDKGDNVVTAGSSSGVSLTAGVTNSRVNFRAGPSTKDEIYKTLGSGVSMDIIGETGSWYYVVCGDRAGFINKTYVDITASGSVGVIKVSSGIAPQSCRTNSEVNMRTGPATGYKKLDTLDEGEKLTVFYVSDGWCFVQRDGEYGFVFDEYVSLS